MCKIDVKITESPLEAADYAKRNIPYIVLLNEENREQSFPNGAYCIEDEADIDDSCRERVYRRFMGLPWDIAETKRLKIREITLSDVTRLYELYSGEDITKYMEPLFEDIAEEIEYTRNYIENVYRFYDYGMWVIELKESGEVIGRVGLEYKEGYEGLELGFMLGTQYQHKGYAYEACRAVIDYGLNELGASCIYALVNAENKASVRLCGRLGFVRMGIVKAAGLDFDEKNAESKNFVYKTTEKELAYYVYDA